MAKVDPFLIPIPKKFLADLETRAFFEYQSRFLHDLWVRSGSGDDVVESISVSEQYPWDTTLPNSDTETGVVQYSSSEGFIEAKEYRAVTVSADYVSLDHDFINALQSCTITLPEYPCENAVVVVRNGDGSTINLDGNGRNINGESTGKLRLKAAAYNFYYFIDTNEWFVR